jgi:hypothetical protein
VVQIAGIAGSAKDRRIKKQRNQAVGDRKEGRKEPPRRQE